MRYTEAANTIGGSPSDVSQTASKSKDLTIESIRGLAILLLVIYHSIIQNETAPVPLLWLATLIDPIIMPLFAFMAGYVYAMRPVDWMHLSKFFQSKVRRILVPFAIATLITYVLKGLLDGYVAWNELYRPLLFSYRHFWFLQSLFVIFVIFAVADALGLFNSARRWALITSALWVLCHIFPGTSFFSLWGVLYLLPIFAVGYGAYQYSALLLSIRALMGWTFIGAVTLTLFVLTQFETLSVPDERTTPVAMLMGTATSIILLNSRFQLRGLVFLGFASYSIYLYHGFGIALGVRLMSKLGLGEDSYECFIAKVMLGLFCPIALALVLAHIKWGRRVLLGQR